MELSTDPTPEEILQVVESINEIDRKIVGENPAPILTPREYGILYGTSPKTSAPSIEEQELSDKVYEMFVDSLNRLADQPKKFQPTPKPVARPKKDGYVTNTAFRDHEGLRNLQRDLHRAKHKNSKGTK